MSTKPRIAVFKFASCDGCQLQILSLQEALILLGSRVEIALFPEASSHMGVGPFDVGFVEGSVSTPEHLEEIKTIREQCGKLVTIGACATAGGIQALRNMADADGYAAAVYANPEYVASLATSTPVAAHVPVDFELYGCPIDKQQLAVVIADLLAGAEPRIPGQSVCIECKRKGYGCVLVGDGEACLGPVTRTGCGAICPGMRRGCYGCFGPADLSFPEHREKPNCEALGARLHELGHESGAIARLFHFINNAAPSFAEAGENWKRYDE